MTRKSQNSQGRKFIEAAREVGASEDPLEFERALRHIAKAPPPATVKNRRKHKTKKPAE